MPTTNGTCGRSSARDADSTTGTGPANPASNDDPIKTVSPMLCWSIVLLFTGRYPGSLYRFVLGMDRRVLWVAACAGLMTDVYPPFRLDQGGPDPGSAPGGLTPPPPGFARRSPGRLRPPPWDEPLAAGSGMLVGAGHRLVANGAAGGAGTYAVQIATALGAEVAGRAARATPGWCARSVPRTSPTTRRKTSPTGARYDVILDNVATGHWAGCAGH